MIPKMETISRWQYLSATVGTILVVLFAAYLDYEADINFMQSASVGGIVLQVFLVKWRETDIAPNKKWRFSYSGVLGFLGLLGIVLIRDFSGTGSSNKAAVGYFIVFLILTLPVLISCSIQKGIKTRI